MCFYVVFVKIIKMPVQHSTTPVTLHACNEEHLLLDAATAYKYSRKQQWGRQNSLEFRQEPSAKHSLKTMSTKFRVNRTKCVPSVILRVSVNTGIKVKVQSNMNIYL